jgi:hypothetical protein
MIGNSYLLIHKSWAEENVDPALFSRELMQHALAAVGKEEVCHTYFVVGT